MGTGYLYRRNNLTRKSELPKSQRVVEVALGSLFGEFRWSNVGRLNLPDSVVVEDFRVIVKDMHEDFIVKTFFAGNAVRQYHETHRGAMGHKVFVVADMWAIASDIRFMSEKMSYRTEYITHYMTMHHLTFPYFISISFWWNWIAFQLSKMSASCFFDDFRLENSFRRKKREIRCSIVAERETDPEWPILSWGDHGQKTGLSVLMCWRFHEYIIVSMASIDPT